MSVRIICVCVRMAMRKVHVMQFILRFRAFIHLRNAKKNGQMQINLNVLGDFTESFAALETIDSGKTKK